MNQDAIERILRCPTLPTLPAVAVRVLELTQDNNISLDDLAEAIHNDQALAAKILRTVNSSFYGLRKPCSTIGQALVMLGLATVKSLALGFSLVSTLSDGADEEFDHIAYWRRGLYTAVAAKCIAHEAGLALEDEAFLGGLLQDMGMMAMYQGLGQAYLRVIVAAGDHRDLVRSELASIELQHPDVGAMLAERWKLPPELLVPIKYHERPTAAPKEYAPLVRCVALGNLAHDVLTDEDPRNAMARFEKRGAEWFTFAPPACDAMLKRIAEGAREISGLFRLDTGPFADADAIIQRAQDQLAHLNERSYREAVASRPEIETLLSDGDEYDPLTGVLGPEAGMAHAELAFERAIAAGKPLSVLKVCLDNINAIVQRLGTEGADAVLFETGVLLQQQFEPTGGRVSRMSPAVFDVLLANVDRLQAVRAAAELRELIQRLSAGWDLAGIESLPLTASVGVASLEPATATVFSKVQQLLTAGQRALDAACQGGGNCVRAFVPKAAA
jgi:two-component system, cell cycle response regulator